MLILLLAYYLTQSAHSEAGPIPASIDVRDVASCDGQYSQRSLAGIVRSCLWTIFLCTWVAVHPNVHFRAEKQHEHWTEKWLWDPLHEIATYKLPLFLWALLVPEYILSWAVRQYLQAGVISEQVPGWTRTHGHFMIMGGFHLFRLPVDAPSVPLPLESLEPSNFVIPSGRHSRRHEVPVCPLRFEDVPVDVLEIFTPSETELKDRGKSDALTKIIVLVQTLWFVIQCIARGSQRLPLTELEVVTLAYATLNFFIYMFWWDKPRNVECPIRVYKTSTARHEEAGEKAKEWVENWVVRWMQKLFGYTTGGQDYYVNLSEKYSIPMFWSGKIDRDLWSAAGLGPSILGSAFGAIHCIAWWSEFSSRPELVLWRISCLAMITVPFLVAMICAVLMANERTGNKDPWWVYAIFVPCVVLLALSAWLYIASRIATLVIAFTALRSLPPAAFTTVDWTTFIPHI
ncbi:hypothetical protein M408DRAFT_129565 [Serendipita vermifera MAFF 305830]|uniref:Uncharacterized protein n=1 Tax=Serendipita vermifera MAFF 305830 TaxID=933852 RepID=A0A0C2W2B6_SERVB|nr:hypothetical protein M408DRAFT_129565 [Serendipita vermifera MAFF 305830]